MRYTTLQTLFAIFLCGQVLFGLSYERPILGGNPKAHQILLKCAAHFTEMRCAFHVLTWAFHWNAQRISVKCAVKCAAHFSEMCSEMCSISVKCAVKCTVKCTAHFTEMCSEMCSTFQWNAFHWNAQWNAQHISVKCAVKMHMLFNRNLSFWFGLS